jgi:hypothetical protein
MRAKNWFAARVPVVPEAQRPTPTRAISAIFIVRDLRVCASSRIFTKWGSMKRNPPDEQRLLFTAYLDCGDEVRFNLVRYGRRSRIDVRCFSYSLAENTYIATRKGTFFPAEDLPEILEALQGTLRPASDGTKAGAASVAPTPQQARSRDRAPAHRKSADELALHMRNRGESLSAIAKALGVGKSTISRRLARLGIVPRPALHGTGGTTERDDATGGGMDAPPQPVAPLTH